MKLLIVIAILSPATTSAVIHNAVETEMFAIPISPNLFNWTYQEFDQQYRFHASLIGKPELPSWLRYIYSGRHHSGFIFGTPPRATKSPITIEVVGLNRQDFETRRVTMTINVESKAKLARHEVELKIDNLNVEDLLDEHRMTQLKDILRTKLWLESNDDLYPTFLASAIDLGARLPLKPSDGEGLVVRLGSSMPFSTELKRLREEVRPLSRLPSCPREYKRTTVERLFRDAEFTLDWCSFELYNTIYKGRATEHWEYLTELPNRSRAAGGPGALAPRGAWAAPRRGALPARAYARPLAAAAALPVALMLLSVAALTAVLCFHYAAIAHKSNKVEVCKYGVTNEQSNDTDVSPSNSLVRPYSPKSTNLAGSYNRPQPPPYMGSASNSLHHRKSGNTDHTTPSTSGHTPEHRALLLEESIKLLNEANISQEFNMLKDQIVDLNDGSEDYVPIKPDELEFALQQGLDEVPDLTKFAVGSIVGPI